MALSLFYYYVFYQNSIILIMSFSLQQLGKNLERSAMQKKLFSDGRWVRAGNIY